MPRQPCWPTCHRASRDCEKDSWESASCDFNKRIVNNEPSVPKSAVLCTSCGRRTCFDCLHLLQKCALSTKREFEDKGLVLVCDAALDALLAGRVLVPDEHSDAEAIVGHTVKQAW